MAFFSITHTLQQRKKFIASEFEREINLTLHVDDETSNANRKLENDEEDHEKTNTKDGDDASGEEKLSSNCKDSTMSTHPEKSEALHDVTNMDIDKELEFDRNELRLELNDDILPPCFNTLLTQQSEVSQQPRSPLLVSPEIDLLKLGSPEFETFIALQDQKDKNKISSKTKNGNMKEHSRSKRLSTESPVMARDPLFVSVSNKQYLHPLLGNERRSPTIVFESDVDFKSSFIEPLQQVPTLDNTQLNNNNIKAAVERYFPIDKNLKYDNLDTSDSRNVKSETSDARLLNEAEDSLKQKDTEIKYNLSKEMLKEYSHYEQELIKAYLTIDPNTDPHNLPPINLELQEVVKRERKKLKNRVAASKCRRKKLEREAQLEVKVSHLKDRSVELNTILNALRREALDLKQRLIQHIDAGCSLELSSGNIHVPSYM